jgi:hypothetical protein
MELPVIVLYTDSQISNINKLKPPNKFYNFLTFNISEYNSQRKIYELCGKYRPVLICSFGELHLFNILNNKYFVLNKKWIHFESVNQFNPRSFITRHTQSSVFDYHTANRNLISFFTTSFHSGNKIFKPFSSITSQTFHNWEWIIWDDSKDLETYKNLVEFHKKDPRIRVFKAPVHNGYIGEMKELSARLARGRWIVEVDHDDEINVNVAKWLNQITETYPHVGFVYTDCSEPFINEKNTVCYHNNYWGRGQSAYIKRFANGFYHNVGISAPPNYKSLSYITGIPNHIRAWRNDIYHKIKCHNPNLPVSDDYELFIRTVLHDVKICRIPELAYFQYRYPNGDNFTFKRNKLIQYLTGNVYDFYKYFIKRYYQLKDGKEYNVDDTKIYYPDWTTTTFEYSKHEIIFDPKDIKPHQPCFSIILTLVNINDEKKLVERIQSIFNQTYQNWKLYIIGCNVSSLENFMNYLNPSKDILENKIYWYNLEISENDYDNILNKKSPEILALNYTLKKLITTKWVIYNKLKWNKNDILNTFYEHTQQKKNSDYFIINKILCHKHSLLYSSGVWEKEFNPKNMIQKWATLKKKNDYF